jgi:HK97 family phage major capsid protein
MDIRDLSNHQVRDQLRQLVKSVEVLERTEQEAAQARGLRAWYGTDNTPSLARAVLALSDNPVSGVLARAVPVEFEQSQRVAKIMGREPRPGYLWWPATRDLTAAVAGSGGYLVDTQHPAGAFIPALRAASIADALGVFRLPMRSNAQFARMTGDISVAWLATEATQTPESTATPTFGTTVASPKTAGGYVEASRAWLMNVSVEGETFIMGQMGKAVAPAADAAMLAGTGVAGQPLGLLSTAGITSASGASLDWTKTTQTMNDLEANNAAVNAGALGWALSPSAELVMKRRERATGSGFILDGGKIDAKRVAVSTSVPTGTAVYGDWSNLVLLEWGAIEVGVDKFGVTGGDLFKRGAIGIRVIYICDVAVLVPKSFSVLTGIT